MLPRNGMRAVLALAMLLTGSFGALAAEGGVWSVGKSSGEVWITATGAAPASLTQQVTLNAGDTIRTGPNGRVLLMRGEETILISPNSVIGLPTESKDGLATTILQRAGSILLDVEKRNVKHFEVETPYLAAVVKGTHFRVTVNAANTRVDVERGQVEVADFKTGQIAQVMPGQAATSFADGKAGLSLSGSGSFNPIEQGKPRASTIERISVPKGGLHAPHGAGEGTSIRALGPAGASRGRITGDAGTPKSGASVNGHMIRLTNALGEVHLDVHKATHGLAHAAVAPGLIGNASRDVARNTIWSDSNSTTSVNASATGSASGNGPGSSGNASSPGSAAGPGTASSASVAAIAAIGAATDNIGNGIGNGATGNGKANGNGGVGNGKGIGNAKH